MNGLCRLLALLIFTAALHAEQATMTTRFFRIPPDFIGYGDERASAVPAAPADPFAGSAPSSTKTTLPPRKTAKEILEAQGVTFPSGATASFNPLTGILTVHNTPQELDAVAVVVDSIIKYAPSTIAYTLTVIEGPGELIRQTNAAASRTTNAAKELATLLGYAKNPGSNMRIVGDAFVEAKSGTRATTEAVREHIYANALVLDAKSRSSVTQDMRRVGLKLEIEPYLSADGFTIESSLSFELQSAPPRSHQVAVTDPITGNTAEFSATEFYGSRFTTDLSSSSGSTKLVAVTKPVGIRAEHVDMLWAAFLTGTARKIEVLPLSKPLATSQINQPPPGLSAAAFNIPEGLFETMMEKPQPLQPWFEANGIVATKGAAAEHKNGVLQIINTTDNIERIAALIDECVNLSSKTVAFTLHTVQAPAAFLRDLTHKASAASDQTEMWTAVEAAAARGEASFINSIFLETKSGTHATHESVREHIYLSEFGTSTKGTPHLAFETRRVGSIFEVDPVIGADGRTLEINFTHELHPAAPETRRDHFRDPASNKPFNMPVVDFHSTKTVTGITLTKGGTKLISLNKPTGRGDADVLWATFLRCDVIAQVAQHRHASDLREGKLLPGGNSKEMETKTFWAPPDFLATGGGDAEAESPPSDKYSKPKVRVITAVDILTNAGVTFPEGATAVFYPDTTTLVVRNTWENLALVEEFVEMLRKTLPATLAFTTHVLQGPGPLLRRLTAQVANKSNHHAELDELLAAAKAGTVQHLDTARIETKSGTRTTLKQTNEHTTITGVSVNDKGEPVFEQEMREIGLRVELEATVGADGVTVELNIAPEFHTAEPFEHREHVIDTQGRKLEFPLTDYHSAKVTTGITMPDGTVHLLSLYKPTGKPEFEKEDILQAIFITCDILRTGE